jgi:hypothetical protein
MVHPIRRIISEEAGNHKVMSNKVKKPSWIPPVVALVAIVLSLAIYLISSLKYSPAIYFAYILTPFIPILSLALARSSDTKARSNVFYDLAKGKKIVTATLILAITGFVVALPVMFHIATELSQI